VPRGFTLLEVLIALTVASMAAVVSFAVLLVPLRTLALDGQIVRAKGVAERALLTALARPCDWASPLPFERTDDVRDEGMRFVQTVRVHVFPGTDLWRFGVEVAWTTAGRRYHTSLVYDHAFYGVTCPQWVPSP